MRSSQHITLTISSFITQPNMYARGILFGKMKYELGDHAIVRCPETGLEVNLEFRVKGWVSGSYNAIGGQIQETKSGKALYELSGFWNREMAIKDLATGKKEVLFDARHAKPSMPMSRPLDEQSPRESQRLWHTTTQAIKKADQKTATDEKSRIEDEQRREAAERGDEEWQPKLFRRAPPDDEEKLDWVINADVDYTAPEERQIEQILAITPILPAHRTRDIQSARTPVQGDLIDFGQHDAPTQAGGKEAPQVQMHQPKRQPGDPVQRQDSMGNDEIFIDADN